MNTIAITQRGPVSRTRPSQVELWLLASEQISALAPRAGEILTDKERAEGPRSPDENARRLWMGRQVALRLVLAEHLGRDPKTLRVRRDGRGKPQVLDTGGVSFSVSSSEGWWLAAVSDQEVGVDLEVIRPLREVEAVAQTYFSPAERAELGALQDPEERLRCFYRCWTRKEALLKLKGLGVSALSALKEQDGGVWIDELALQEGLSASLAMLKPPTWVRRRSWSGFGEGAGPAGAVEADFPGLKGRRENKGASRDGADAGGDTDRSAYLLSEIGGNEAERLRKQAAFYLSLELPQILETLPRRGRFVDLGCGVGLLADAVAAACPDATVYGYDVDAVAVEKSRQYFGDHRGLQFECRGIEQGPPEGFPGADVAIIRLVLLHQKDPRRVLEAARAWLKPGGILHVVEADDRHLSFEPSPVWLPELLDLMQTVQQRRGGDRRLGEDLAALVEAVGWRVLGHREFALDPLATAAAVPKVFLPVAEMQLAEAERQGLAAPQTLRALRKGLDEVRDGHLALARARIPLFHVWAQNHL